jgi:YggT family protein
MEALAKIILTAIEFYSFALIGYILLSWFPNARESGIGKFLATICEPYLEPFRRFIPPLGMIDISPIVAIISLNFASMGVVSLFNMLS